MSSIDLFEGRLHNTVSAGAHADFLEPPDNHIADEGCPPRYHVCDWCGHERPTHSVAFGLTDLDTADPEAPPPGILEVCDICIERLTAALRDLVTTADAVTAWAEDHVDGQYTLEHAVFTHLRNTAGHAQRALAGLFPEDVNLCPHNEDPRACWDCNVDPWVEEKFLN